MRNTAKPYHSHLTSRNSLITSDIAFSARFASLVLEKKRRTEPFVQLAHALRSAAASVTSPNDLTHIKGIQSTLLTASGISYKDSIHLKPKAKKEVIQDFIDNVLIPAGSNFVPELVHRFLLTHYDALDKTMQNIGDILAQRKLSRAIISALAIAGIPYRWRHSINNSWVNMPDEDSDIELHVCGLSWHKGSQRRTALFNLTLPFLKKSVGLCLFNCNPEELSANYNSLSAYVAFGELKDGIDSVRADAHWKTAQTALAHINTLFAQKDLLPPTFFIGAAITKKMAQEIWTQLEDGSLANAANLADEDQVASISRWLCNL